ncbi:alpha-N-acetylneuraminide alpha-2,8-sialyltransferase isoform X2 [Orcinus orca]|uniref:alpha-N-acetylneuraminide alpha-2,8-sialyltransferase isoform X2 n=1 Tax=Orcinus orca TaxID=9733 RepID=UPI0021136F83|nr:alpha-N-acetylneuraminide alpha-2,8-sialyltransferase isoform X2 [Orcinus orca]
MSPCGRARRHTSRGAMAVLAWKFPRTRLPVGASALCVVVLCWLYIFPVYRLPNEKEIVQGVLQQGTAWRRNQTAARVFRKQMEDCCDPAHLFAMTKMNSPMGKSMWYDGEFLYSFTIDNSTYSLFPQATPFQLPLKKCAVVGNGGILKKSDCGRQIDEANFVMRCNLPPLSSEYTKDVGSKSHLVTANPSIIRQREERKNGDGEDADDGDDDDGVDSDDDDNGDYDDDGDGDHGDDGGDDDDKAKIIRILMCRALFKVHHAYELT